MDRGAWQATIHGVAKSRTGLSDFHFPCWLLGQEDPLKEGVATHFSILAWRIPWTKDPGERQSMGLKMSN